MKNIVVVGGGVGGLELVTRLGKKVKQDEISITLIDDTPTHIWKPLLHEAAAGSLNSNEDEINYLAFASTHNFKFILGSMIGLKKENKLVKLAPLKSEDGEIILPEREIPYDVLVIAVGSIANDFGIKGVREHCCFIDNREEADDFHQHFLNKLLQFSATDQKQPFTISIVGGGATGIELAAELHNAVNVMSHYGITIDPNNIQFSLIEAATQLLPALPKRISETVLNELEKLNIHVYLNEQVIEVTDQYFITKSNKKIPGDLKIWTAGIKAPNFLSNLGLECNRNNQIIVKQTLQSVSDPSIFAIGDCALCIIQKTEKPVPPRAQAAHQEAKFLTKSILKYLKGEQLPDYEYTDYGSLISLSHYNIIGSLMGRMTRSFAVEGSIARFFYYSLYKQHLTTLFGPWKVALMSLANLLNRKVKPRLKLH